MADSPDQTANDSQISLAVLAVEDSADHACLIKRAFDKSPFQVTLTMAANLAEARRQLAVAIPDVVLADLRLPDGVGTDLLTFSESGLPVVLMTSFGDEAEAVRAIKSGALDYVAETEHSFDDLPHICRRAARDWRLQRQQHETQQLLARSESRYRILFENAPAGVFQCAPDGEMLLANPECSRIFGFTDSNALLGRNFFKELIIDSDKKTSLEQAQGNIKNMEVQLRRIDGQTAIALVSLAPVEEHGCVCCYEGFLVDVTGEREADAALAQSEARFRNLFENASEAIVVLDVERGRFVDLNQNAVNLFGASKSALLKMNPLDLSPAIQSDRELSRPAAERLIQSAVAGQKPVFEWLHKTVAGREVPCEVRLVRLPDSNRVLVRGAITDISERKAAENRLREQERRMSALVESATAGILEISEAGLVISANPAAVGMLGHNHAAELEDSSFNQHVIEGDRTRIKEALRSAWDGHESSLVFQVSMGAGQRMLAGSFIAIRGADGALDRVMLMCDDITLRHASARQIKEEQHFTDALINSLPGTFFVYSEAGQLLRFNKRFLETSGYSEEEARSMGPLDFFDEANRPIAAAGLQKVFETGEHQMEAWVKRKDGELLPFSFNASLLEQEGQRFMVGVGIDISDRLRNEQRFREEKKFADTVINSMPGVFYVLDTNNRIVRWNDNLARLLGLSREKLSEIDPLSTIAPEHREQVVATIKKVFAEGHGQAEANFITGDGREVPYLFTGVRLRSDDQQYMVGMGFDISERRQYESQLRASENYLRSVVQSEPECVWTLDRSGCLLDINPAGKLMLGETTIAYLQKNSVASLLDAGQRRAFLQLNESVFAGHSGILTFRIQTREGEALWLETHAVALRGDGDEITGHLAVTRDITAKRAADRKIRQYSERLKKLSARLLETQESERRHLARELHDEVGQSLTALKLDLEGNAISRNAQEPDSIAIVDRILHQVRDMSLDLRPAMLDDLGLLAALRWFVDRQGERAGLDTQVKADSLTGVRLDSGVETAAFRIVQEALTNIVRHADARRVVVNLVLDNERLNIEITDDGCGFDVSRQLKATAQGGSFGLLGMQERAVLMGGYARVSSNPGEGTTVAAWLPLSHHVGGVSMARTG